MAIKYMIILSYFMQNEQFLPSRSDMLRSVPVDKIRTKFIKGKTLEKRILIAQTAFLGDALLAIPLVKSVRRIFPEHELVFYCRNGVAELFLRNHLVDKVVEVNKKNKESLREASEKLGRMSYDIILAPHRSFRTANLVRKLQANKKISFKSWWNSWIFDESHSYVQEIPDALRQLSLLSGLDSKLSNDYRSLLKQVKENPKLITGLDNLNERLFVPDWALMVLDKKTVSADLAQELNEQLLEMGFSFDEPWALLAPGSVWATKRWTLEGYAKVANDLIKRGFRVGLIGVKDERDICQKLILRVPEVTDFSGKTTVFQLWWQLHHTKLLVSNDSGAMHVGACAGCPNVTVFGPTTLDLGYRPWQDKALVVEKKDLECRPCGKHGHNHCPIETHDCMEAIKASEVTTAIEKLLENAKGDPHVG
jgi:heptosyltransferase-2